MAATQAHYSLSQNCLHSLLQINRNLIQSFAALTGNAMLLKVAESIPNNIDQMTKVAGLNCNTFETYAVCTTCSNIYKEDTLCQENNSELEVSECTQIAQQCTRLHEMRINTILMDHLYVSVLGYHQMQQSAIP
jgi:hypothetical protein